MDPTHGIYKPEIPVWRLPFTSGAWPRGCSRPRGVFETKYTAPAVAPTEMFCEARGSRRLDDLVSTSAHRVTQLAYFPAEDAVPLRLW